MIDVLYVSPDAFRAKPQIGRPLTMTWHELALYLSRPSTGEAKDAAGAWSPALYTDNIRRKSSLVSIGALVVDLDENGVEVASELVERYSAIVHETFSSTTAAPRCRVVLQLSELVDAPTYEATHKIVRARLAVEGLIADEGAKDASRLSYAPVRRPGAGYGFRVTEGIKLDARAVLAAQPAPAPRPAVRLPSPEHADAYARGALRRAADAVASASPGARHYHLCREAYCLARLDELRFEEIAGALLPAFVAVAGSSRQAEGERTIRDAWRARKGST